MAAFLLNSPPNYPGSDRHDEAPFRPCISSVQAQVSTLGHHISRYACCNDYESYDRRFTTFFHELSPLTRFFTSLGAESQYAHKTQWKRQNSTRVPWKTRMNG